MKQIEIFYLTGCPYCVSTRRAIAQLQAEVPAYAGIELQWIEETGNWALAQSRDYYYVPTLYYEGEKLYECRPMHSDASIKKHIREAFDRVLSA